MSGIVKGSSQSGIGLVVAEMSTQDSEWANVKASQIPQSILDYVEKASSEGQEPRQIQKALGLTGHNDRRWQLILRALTRGFKVNGSLFVTRWVEKQAEVADIIHRQMMKKQEAGIPLNRDDAMLISAMSNMLEKIPSAAKAWGLLPDPKENKGGGAPVTIVVKTNVPLPSQATVEAYKGKKLAEAINLLQGDLGADSKPKAKLPQDG